MSVFLYIFCVTYNKNLTFNFKYTNPYSVISNDSFFFSIHIAWEGQLCKNDVNGCTEVSCFNDSTCTDIPGPGVGAECPPCPTGYMLKMDLNAQVQY